MNAHRASLQLPLLTHDDRVAEIARRHSAAMASGARPFGHDGFDSRVSEIRSFLTVLGAAENLALDNRSGPELAGLVVRGWIGSPGHRRNIEGSYDVTGVGAATDPRGVVYFTQIFVERR